MHIKHFLQDVTLKYSQLDLDLKKKIDLYLIKKDCDCFFGDALSKIESFIVLS